MFSASSWESGKPAPAGRNMYTTSSEVGEERILVGLYGKVAIGRVRNAAASKSRCALTWACSCRQRHSRCCLHFQVVFGRGTYFAQLFKTITERVSWLLMLTGWLEVNSGGGRMRGEGCVDVKDGGKSQGTYVQVQDAICKANARHESICMPA